MTTFARIMQSALLTGALAICAATAHAQGGRGGAPQGTPIQQGSTAPMRVSPGVTAGNIVTRVPPKYPQAAKEARVQGAVVLSVTIGKDGAVKEIGILSGPDVLQQSAVDAVGQWTYRPMMLNGAPVEVVTEVTVNYTLN
jgi:protein TonB